MQGVRTEEFEGLICNLKDANLYKLPPTLKCKDNEARRVRVKEKNIEWYKSEANSLQVTIYTCEVSQNFFGAKTFRRSTTTKILLEQQYRDFISTRSCIDEGRNMHRNADMRPGQGMSAIPNGQRQL